MEPYWRNEQHGLTIYHGDCLEVMPGLGQEVVTLLWTDPPYGHSNMDGDLQAARVRDNVAGARKQECVPIANDWSPATGWGGRALASRSASNTASLRRGGWNAR